MAHLVPACSACGCRNFRVKQTRTDPVTVDLTKSLANAMRWFECVGCGERIILGPHEGINVKQIVNVGDARE